MSIFHLVYGSQAKPEISNVDVFEILEKSRINNAKVKVTGLLLFRTPRFLQVLEGEEEAVRATYARILNDSRHFSPQIFLEFSDAERIFPQWAMGYPEKSPVRIPGEDLFETISVMLKGTNNGKEQVVKALKRFNLG
jgi:hypothetical protein